jgi:hypothetical protein
MRFTSEPPGNLDLYNGSFQEITTAGDASVGQAVAQAGAVTGKPSSPAAPASSLS